MRYTIGRSESSKGPSGMNPLNVGILDVNLIEQIPRREYQTGGPNTPGGYRALQEARRDGGGGGEDGGNGERVHRGGKYTRQVQARQGLGSRGRGRVRPIHRYIDVRCSCHVTLITATRYCSIDVKDTVPDIWSKCLDLFNMFDASDPVLPTEPRPSVKYLLNLLSTALNISSSDIFV